MANTNKCVVIMLSQLSRPGAMTNPAKFRPTMSNLKEAGELEADSDYVGILHRPYVLCKDSPGEVRPEDGYVLIDKNKFGRTGQIHLFLDGKHQTFYEVEGVPAGFVAMPPNTPTPFD
jgi:replicative DNA helicase